MNALGIIAILIGIGLILAISTGKNKSQGSKKTASNTSVNSTSGSLSSKILKTVFLIVVGLGIWSLYINWDNFDFGNGIVFDQQVRPQKGGKPIPFIADPSASYQLYISGTRNQFTTSKEHGTGYVLKSADGRSLNKNNRKYYENGPNVLSPNDPWGAAIVWIDEKKHYLNTGQSLSFVGRHNIRIDLNVEQDDPRFYTKSHGSYNVIIKRV